jgi:hypothetical protein
MNNVVLAVPAMFDVEQVGDEINRYLNSPEQVLLSQEVLPVNVDHVDMDVNADAMDGNNVNKNVNVNNVQQVLLVNMEKVKRKGKVRILAVLDMLDVMAMGDTNIEDEYDSITYFIRQSSTKTEQTLASSDFFN